MLTSKINKHCGEIFISSKDKIKQKYRLPTSDHTYIWCVFFLQMGFNMTADLTIHNLVADYNSKDIIIFFHTPPTQTHTHTHTKLMLYYFRPPTPHPQYVLMG